MSLLLLATIQVSALTAQEVIIWVEDVTTGGSLAPGHADVQIYISTTVPIHSYSFSLSGFDNVLTSDASQFQPDGLAWTIFGEDNVNLTENYFSGGGVGDAIEAQTDAPFISVIGSYNENLDDALENSSITPHYLTFDEVIPGLMLKIIYILGLDLL